MSTKNMEKAEENLRYATLGFKEGLLLQATFLKHKQPGYPLNRKRLTLK